jgi:hypothetical protein
MDKSSLSEALPSARPFKWSTPAGRFEIHDVPGLETKSALAVGSAPPDFGLLTFVDSTGSTTEFPREAKLYKARSRTPVDLDKANRVGSYLNFSSSTSTC